MTVFEKISAMNEAFGNAKGDPTNINWAKVRKQSLNIIDEWVELMHGLGADVTMLSVRVDALKSLIFFDQEPNIEAVRDASRDIVVFADGVHHLMGIDADRDMDSVLNGVMSRFIKDDFDKEATIAKHAAKGVTEVYFEGSYPTMIIKSAVDQLDAPQGKFLKAASYKEPTFYEI